MSPVRKISDARRNRVVVVLDNDDDEEEVTEAGPRADSSPCPVLLLEKVPAKCTSQARGYTAAQSRLPRRGRDNIATVDPSERLYILVRIIRRSRYLRYGKSVDNTHRCTEYASVVSSCELLTCIFRCSRATMVRVKK